MKNKRLYWYGLVILAFFCLPATVWAADSPVGVEYRGHIQDIGNFPQDENTWIQSAKQLGTTGECKRIEGFRIRLTGADSLPAGASIRYNVHVENVGWLAETDLSATGTWLADGAFAGSEGHSQRIEAIQIVLTGADGQALPGYSVQYLVHGQDYGWTQGWQADGAIAGTTSQSKRLEAIQIRIVKTQAEPVVYDQAGTYGPATGTQTIAGDVTVAADGVVLNNLVIAGNLTISEAVGDGTVTLNNVTVKGDTLVRGGGVHSIKINGGQYSRIVMEKTASGAVRIVATGVDGLPVVVSEAAAGETIILEGGFASVTVNAPNMNVTTQGNTTTIGTMTVGADATGSTLNLASGTTVADLVISGKAAVKGQGNVAKAEVNADGVVFDKKPGAYTVEPDVVIPPVFPADSDGGGGNSGPTTIPVTAVSLNKTAIALAVNVTDSLTATVAPATATNKAVTWSSSDDTIATVDATGKVTAVKEGQATITVTSQDGSKKATCTVAVKDLKQTIAGVTVPFAGEIPVTAITATGQFSGTVSWQKKDGSGLTALAKDEKFDGTSTYVATITLTIKAPYTAADIPLNFFAVAGATAINGAGELVVTAEFLPIHQYKITGLGVITAYSGPGENVVVPATVNSTVVTGIGDNAFSNQNTITEISLPATVTAIGNGAFYSCTSLTAVTFEAPANLKTIGDCTFTNCQLLKSITIPNQVTAIGASAFGGCTALDTVTFATPSELTSIGAGAFSQCQALSTIIIPAKVTSLGDRAFSNCAFLNKVTITGNLTTIKDYTFYGCDVLSQINIPDSVQSIGEAAFSGCYQIFSITIPATVTSLGADAFNNCLSLTSVTFTGQSALSTIGQKAFFNCQYLTAIEIPPQVKTISADAFGFENYKSPISRRYTFRGDVPTTMGAGALPTTAPIPTIKYYANYSGYTAAAWAGYPNKAVILAPPVLGEPVATNTGTPAVELSWGGSIPGVTGYQVDISENSDLSAATSITVSDAQAIINTGLEAGKSYYFTVKAHDAYGESLWSDAKSVLVPYQYPVESIIVSANPATLVIGKTGQLSAAFTPANASNQTVSWSSGNVGIASVDAASGVITANEIGTVEMTGTTADGGETGTCQVTVVPDQVTGVTLNQASLSVGVTKTAQLTATVAPAGVTNPAVNWTSSDETIATVDATGKVKGIKEGGPVTIIATTAEGTFTKSCMVTVTEGYDVSVTDNKATITGYYGENKAVDIPDTIVVDGTMVDVVAIDDGAFSKTLTEINAGDAGITAVTIPATVTRIGAKAFNLCVQLKTVTFDSGSQLTTIGVSSFEQCRALTTIALPPTVTAIGTGAFGTCVSLYNLTLPDSLTTIGDRAFSLSGLTAITIPAQVTTIPTSAFYGCSNLATINLPAGLQSIGDTAFVFASGQTPIARTFTFTGKAPTLGTGAIPVTTGGAITTIRYPAAQTGFDIAPWTDCTVVGY